MQKVSSARQNVKKAQNHRNGGSTQLFFELSNAAKALWRLVAAQH